MYISLDWLKDFVKIPAKITPTEIATSLTRHTVEVEGVIDRADKFTGVVVGRVLEVNPHPNADRLRLTRVDVGRETLDIVCGAPNIAVGQIVPVAKVGAILPSGVEIKAAEIRGAKSEGMVCAEDELDLGKDHEGIMVLEDRVKIGSPFSKYLKASGYTLDIDNKSLSNRPDLLSHYGIAREIGVIFDLPIKPYSKFLDKIVFLQSDNKLVAKVEDRENCRRYQAVRLENVTIKESPAWIKERLISIGQRSINNIVDLTNYVMFETGQPLHAFSVDQVNRLTIRRAKKSELITLLDGQDYGLDEQDLVIASDNGPVALAGIMGGLDSGVKSETQAIILEAANFRAATVRRTAQKLGLRSESSVRFEKSLDPRLTELAVSRFITLLKKDCPDMVVASELVDIGGDQLEPAPTIELDLNWLDNKIGQAIGRTKVISILERLGFSISDSQNDILKITVPSWRATRDINTKEDVAEEVLRFFGYDNVASWLPTQKLVLPEQNYSRSLARRVKEFLVLKHALTEFYNYSFISEDWLTKLDIDFSHHLRLANPLSELYTLLRRDLAPGLIANIRNNQAKSDQLALFEFGSVFSAVPGSWKKEKNSNETLPYQEQRLGIVLADDEEDLMGRAKGVVASLLAYMMGYGKEVEFSPLASVPHWAEEGASANIMIRSHEIGFITLVNKQVASNINLKKPVVIAELNFNLLTELSRGSDVPHWQEAAKYPALNRDLAIVVGEKILYNDLKKEISKFDPLIVSVELFDSYSGDKLSAGEKSLAFHLEYQAADRTLTSSEVDKKEEELVVYLQERFSARLRKF
jgi:phenylalanyl-tRNA synthetase beta chain